MNIDNLDDEALLSQIRADIAAIRASIDLQRRHLKKSKQIFRRFRQIESEWMGLVLSPLEMARRLAAAEGTTKSRNVSSFNNP
jgi:hypothetical protein